MTRHTNFEFLKSFDDRILKFFQVRAKFFFADSDDVPTFYWKTREKKKNNEEVNKWANLKLLKKVELENLFACKLIDS